MTAQEANAISILNDKYVDSGQSKLEIALEKVYAIIKQRAGEGIYCAIVHFSTQNKDLSLLVKHQLEKEGYQVFKTVNFLQSQPNSEVPFVINWGKGIINQKQSNGIE